MTEKLTYKTKQRERLMAYLRSVQGRHFTAGEVCEHFNKDGEKMGAATVYRQLERMVDEGIVNKYTIDGASPACFEYIGSGIHSADEVCYHCKCEKCGALIHLHCDELNEIKEHLRSSHDFFLDTKRTVFYGLCSECANAGV